MISFQQACELILSETKALPEESVVVKDALGRVLTQNVYSASDQPRFDNAAVDGYAFRFEQGQRTYRLVGDVAAGGQFKEGLQRGDCVRIFTGAQMPVGADTCVMQEYAERTGRHMSHQDEGLKKGANVRLQGEELNAGALLMKKGTKVNAQAIGLLSASGLEELHVVRTPRVHVIITGSEFTTPAENEEGKIYNSNGPMLEAALHANGLACVLEQVDDDRSALQRAVEQAIKTADLVISTGGVSVGDHDHVRSVCESAGMRTVFHKVAQKPGKPMYFGTHRNAYFLGLPGNPRAVMIGFWMHVLPLLRAMQGESNPQVQVERLPLGEFFKVKGTRTELLAVRIEQGQVFIARKQNSHMLQTLLDADGIAVIPATQASFNVGDLVGVFRLN